MVWGVVLRCGVVCGVVWCGVVWCGVVWRGVAWCGVVWCGVVWCGVVWCSVVWCGVVWCGVLCGVVWCGVVWCGVVWCGVLCCVVLRRFVVDTVLHATVLHATTRVSPCGVDSAPSRPLPPLPLPSLQCQGRRPRGGPTSQWHSAVVASATRVKRRGAEKLSRALCPVNTPFSAILTLFTSQCLNNAPVDQTPPTPHTRGTTPPPSAHALERAISTVPPLICTTSLWQCQVLPNLILC